MSTERIGGGEGTAQAGVVYGLASSALMGTSSALVHASGGHPAAQVAFARGIIGLIVIAPVVRSDWRCLTQPQAGSMWAFGLGGALSILCFFGNLQEASVGTSYALFNLTPLFVSLLAAVVLKERITSAQIVGVGLVVAGVTVLQRSPLSHPSNRVLVRGVVGALFAASGYVALRRAVVVRPGPLSLVPLFAMLCLIAPLMPSGHWRMPSPSGAALIVAVGLCAAGGHFLLTQSFARLPASVASGLAPTSFIWAVAIGAIHGDRPLLEDWFGYGLAAVGAILLNVAGRRSTPPSDDAANPIAPIPSAATSEADRA